ncbi:MAG: hypothetical protein H7318_14715 [Oligoflexus sp.]|nr:hypothetical protein [Oligoflexus sp.]
MHIEWYYWVLGAILSILFLAGALFLYLRGALPTAPEIPTLPLPVEPILLKYASATTIHPSSRSIADQPKEWRESLRRSGAILKAAGVKEIILLHGTFVGSDPINLVSSMKSLFPKLSREAEEGMGRRMKGIIDYVAQDNGNFVPKYIELLEQGLEAKIPVKLQFWSSANHHLGRLEGAIRLLEKVSVDFPQSQSDRILLIGHSHARQVFALFTQLILGSQVSTGLGSDLWQFAVRERLATEELRTKAKHLRKQRFDFVTLGGPVRYPWTYIPDMRVLHIVNHRGDNSSIAEPWAFWKGSGGDFVQQWGMIGSDTLAPTPRERQLNRGLDDLLGKGWHTRLWIQSIVRRERLGDFGRTLLVDYGHEQPNKNNFIRAVFGHGVYTRFDIMHFQMEVICKYIYS